MKHLLILSALILTVTSCITKTQHAEELAATRDSLNAVVASREAKIGSFLDDFNEIQMNLDSIKQIENLISIKSDDKEMSVSVKKQIINDFSRLQQLAEKNKQLVADLKKMRSSDLQKNKALTKTIGILEKQLLEKDAVIADLNDKITTLNFDVSNLKASLDALKKESELKTQALLAKEDKMSEAWYLFASKDSLIANNIAFKKGGFLGLGKSVVLADDLDSDEFIMIDVRNFSSVELNVKEASLLSVHPEGSYHFDGTDDSVQALVIDSPSEFWSITKYLVIMTE